MYVYGVMGGKGVTIASSKIDNVPKGEVTKGSKKTRDLGKGMV